MESEVEQKLSFGHTSTDSETSSSVCSHSEATGHDQWVCSKCRGAGYNIEGTTGRVQGRKHRRKSNRGAQVTFDHQEEDEVGYRMSEPKVPSYHAQHLPCSSKLGGSNLDDHHLLDTNRYQPTTSHLTREYMFQPSVLFSQRPVATSTPSNLDKYRHSHVHKRREHFSPSIAPADLHLSLPENLTGATPLHTRVRERGSHRRYPNHISLADSSSEDEQEVGYVSPEQYYDIKKRTKPQKMGYYSGASYTSRRSQFRVPYLPATDEVYFSDPTVVSPQRRRRSGVGRVVVANPRSVEGMYLMEGEHSSGSEAEVSMQTVVFLVQNHNQIHGNTRCGISIVTRLIFTSCLLPWQHKSMQEMTDTIHIVTASYSVVSRIVNYLAHKSMRTETLIVIQVGSAVSLFTVCTDH